MKFEREKLQPARDRFRALTIGTDPTEMPPEDGGDGTDTAGTGVPRPAPGTAYNPDPATPNPNGQALAMEAQVAIGKIMNSTLSHAEKMKRVRAVNERVAARMQAR